MEKDKISVDTDALVNAAEKVDRSVTEISAGVKKFQSIIENLNSTWSSDVKDKFFRNYEKDLKALNDMIAQYSEIAGGLRYLSEQHQQTEADIKAKIDKARKSYG